VRCAGRSGELGVDEATRALSYLAPDMPYSDRLKYMIAVDDGDGKLQRWEWVELCADCLWKYPKEQLDMAANNYVLAHSYKRLTNMQKWRTIAARIDAFCRFWMVLAFCTAFGFLFGARLWDPYAPSGYKELAASVQRSFVGGPRAYDGSFMFYGIWDLTFTSMGFWLAMIAPLFLLLLGVMWLSAKLLVSYKQDHFKNVSLQGKEGGANKAADAFTRIHERAGRATDGGHIRRYSFGSSPGEIANGEAEDRQLST